MLATRHDPPFFRRPLVLLLTLLILAGTIAAADKKGPSDLVFIGAKVYPSPSAAPIENAVIVIRDGKIVDIGPDGRVKAPKGVPFIDCGGKVITAGFWNSHVHFTEDVWNGAASAPVAKLEPHMQTMLTSWGFTSVFDIGSNPRDTVPLRERVDSGEILGTEDLHHRRQYLPRERNSCLRSPGHSQAADTTGSGNAGGR